MIAVIGTSMSMQIHDTLLAASHNIATVSNEISATTEELGVTVPHLAQEFIRVKCYN